MVKNRIEMSKSNNIGFRPYSKKHKEILEEAAENHYTGTLSGFFKQWVVVICRLVQAEISAEWMIANIDKVVEFCRMESGARGRVASAVNLLLDTGISLDKFRDACKMAALMHKKGICFRRVCDKIEKVKSLVNR